MVRIEGKEYRTAQEWKKQGIQDAQHKQPIRYPENKDYRDGYQSVVTFEFHVSSIIPSKGQIIMNKTRDAKELALRALKTLEDRVERIGTQDENYAVLRNTQCTLEALLETLPPVDTP